VEKTFLDQPILGNAQCFCGGMHLGVSGQKLCNFSRNILKFVCNHIGTLCQLRQQFRIAVVAMQMLTQLVGAGIGGGIKKDKIQP
jgi:hypothetical protein